MILLKNILKFEINLKIKIFFLKYIKSLLLIFLRSIFKKKYFIFNNNILKN